MTQNDKSRTGRGRPGPLVQILNGVTAFLANNLMI